MSRIINAHGFSFLVEGHGFVASHTYPDFEKGCDAIEETMNDMPRELIEQLSQDDLATDANCHVWGHLIAVGRDVATKGWWRPEAAAITITAVK